jgi:hypothetical protein
MMRLFSKAHEPPQSMARIQFTRMTGCAAHQSK